MDSNPPTPQVNPASEGNNYFRNVIDNEFPELANQFESMSASALEDSSLIAISEIGAETTAAMEGIEPLGFATAMLLGMYAGGWLLQKVARLFPNPGIFGWHPLNFMVEGITNLGVAWQHDALVVADVVKHYFMQPIRSILAIFQRIGNAISSAHNKIAQIVNVVIPTVAADVLERAATRTLDEVENIKTQLSGAVERFADAPSEGTAKTLIADAAKYGGIGWEVTAIAAGAVVAADETAKQLFTTANDNIATATAKVAQQAQDNLDAVQRQLVQQLTGDENTLSKLSQVVNVTLPQDIADKVQAAQSTEAKNLSNATSALQSEIDTIQGQITTLTNRITTDENTIATAKANITTLQNQSGDNTTAIATEQVQIAKAQSDILSNITSIKDLNTQITGISNTLAPIQTAQQLNTSQLSPFEGVGDVMIPTVLATISSTLNNLKTKVDTCSVETCDPSSPLHIKNQLLSLLSLLTAAGEIGFIAEAINDPLGTANALAPLLDGIDSGAVSTWNAILGIL